MSEKAGDLVNGADGSSLEGIKVLALSFPGADELGQDLQTVLWPARNVEILREKVPDADWSGSSRRLSGILAKVRPSLVVLCLPSAGMAGLEVVFGAVRQDRPETPVVVVMATAATDQLQRLISLGTADFCLAPLRLDDLLPRIMRWSSRPSHKSPVMQQLERAVGLQQFLGESRVFLEAVSNIPRFARCDANVFITGETGTGKEMCARAIHQLGPRSDQAFVPVNCGAIPSELVENELFGHDAGAFTSATCTIRGLIHEAEGGTLFLDEIDSLPLQAQVKFLRFLQDQEYRPLGTRKSLQADVRIIAASNIDLESVVLSRSFRSDLFYRLNVLPLKLPPLRARREDIPLLARHFAAKYARESSTPARVLSSSAIDKLVSYQWPGNVRELENIIERAVILSDRPVITGEDIRLTGPPAPQCDMSFKALKQRAIAEFETNYIRNVLAANDGNISKAARAAKKNRRAFWHLMHKHELAARRTLPPQRP